MANLRSLRLIIESVRGMDRWEWQEIKWHGGGTAEFADDAEIRCFDRKVRHNHQVWHEKILEITDVEVRDLLA
jgi:hypothetical protein